MVENILLTGSEGYIGTKVSRMIDNPERDQVLYRFDIENNSSVCRPLDLENVITDVFTPGKTAIVHLAGIVGDPACKADLIEAHKTNVEGCRNVIDICDRYNLPLVNISTCSVYGDSGGDGVAPVSYYALSKWITEREIRGRLDNYVNLRLGTVYGFSQTTGGVDKTRYELVINKMVKDAAQKGEVTVYGGDQKRPFVSVRSVATAIDATVRKFDEKKQQDTFDVVEFSMSIGRLAEIISEVTGADLKIEDGKTDDRDYSRSGDRFYEEVCNLKKHFREEIEILYRACGSKGENVT